jgi:hypothetical protein
LEGGDGLAVGRHDADAALAALDVGCNAQGVLLEAG